MTNRKFRISGSDIKALHKCEFRWYYERHLELVPIAGYPAAMQLGTKGHFIMERGFQVLLDGGSKEDAIAEATRFALTEYPGEADVVKIMRNIIAFIEYFVEQPWRLVALEDTHFHPVDDDKEFAFTPDLIFEITKGVYKGQLVIGDYKFTGQYWVDREINMYQQIPRYILFKNKAGFNIRRGVVIMLNTRAAESATGSKLFLPKWVDPKPGRLANLERETAVAIDRIKFLKDMSDLAGNDFLKELLMHTSDEKTCKMCFFADDICPMEFDGRDASKAMRLNYKRNDTYGYNHDTVDGKPANA